jgi:hypothetical protein
MQYLPFVYLWNRIRFDENDADWDITFLAFEYDGSELPDGRLGFSHCRTVRTTLASFISALAANNRAGGGLREDFLKQVRIKAGRV